MVVLQGLTMEGLYRLANIYKVLCYNVWLEDYKGFCWIATNLIKKTC